MAKKKITKKFVKKKVRKKVPKKAPAKKTPAKKAPAKKKSEAKKPPKKKTPVTDESSVEDSKTDPTADTGDSGAKVEHVDDMYSEWFIDYASYVILERAVPHVNDGLKPVQRRILYSLKEKEDGTYNKVANIGGHAAQYHPHGDASINAALVQLGQKELLIDTQGNWGNVPTGDKAAAPRYIEARLTKFALEVVFNAKTTNWKASYDGKNKEPVTLPVKFPLLLAQGAEGIAVGLACKILPHNFIELIDGCIDALRKKKTDILPDFLTGGIMDATDYNDGLRGGKVRVRARIEKMKKGRILKITEIPFGTTTGGLKDSILSANDKGKLKIQKIDDNTAENVEILIYLPPGMDSDTAIEALYAFTDCEISISPNACVIEDNKPKFLGVNELLKRAAFQTKDLLQLELEIRLGELEDKWHFFSLEKIFIENRIYRRIEEATTWEEVMSEIWAGLKPFLKLLKRKVVDDDIVRLTEIKIKRISKYNSFKADEHIRGIEGEIEEVKGNLAQLTRYAIRYFKELKKKYGAGRERRTEISSFEKIVAKKVVIANDTLYLNAKDGMAGWGIKRDSVAVEKCSRMDDVIVFGKDGTMQVRKISDKAFVGKNPSHVAVFRRDTPKWYCMVYRDGRDGRAMAKRFTVTGVTREKMYDLTKGTKGSRVLFFSVHNSEEEAVPVVTVHLKPALRLRNVEIELDFAEIAVKGRGANGLTVTKNPVSKVVRSKK